MQLPPEFIPFAERRALRMAEVYQYCGLGRTTIYDAIHAGRIESVKVGKRRLVMRESLDKFVTPKPSP
jgi:excisionase family DNA binding protein